MRDFFLAHMFTELQMITEALQKYQSLKEAGFSKSTYIISQIAVAYHNIRGLFIIIIITHRLIWPSTSDVWIGMMHMGTKRWLHKTSVLIVHVNGLIRRKYTHYFFTLVYQALIHSPNGHTPLTMHYG